MTVINTNYSSLIDAWGDDFFIKKFNINKKNKKDPLCELYARQYKNKVDPYTEKRRPSSSPDYPLKFKLNQEDYDKYYGYKDARKFSRTRRNLKNTNPTTSIQHYKSNDHFDDKYTYSVDEDNDVDDYTLNYTFNQGDPNTKFRKYKDINTNSQLLRNTQPQQSKYSNFCKESNISHKQHKQPKQSTQYKQHYQPKQPNQPKQLKPSSKSHRQPKEFRRIDKNYVNDYDNDYNDIVEDENLIIIDHEDDVIDNHDKYVDNEEDEYVEDEEEEYVEHEDEDEFIEDEYVENENEDEFIEDEYVENENEDENVDDEDENVDVESEYVTNRKLQKKKYMKKKNNTSSKIRENERHMLDVAIYSLSGVILIFMMEQFVQIGINIKNV